MAKDDEEDSKRQIKAHRFASCQAIVIPHVGVVLCLKTERDVEGIGGEGPSLSVLFPIKDAREVAAALSISAEDAAAGNGPPDRAKAN